LLTGDFLNSVIQDSSWSELACAVISHVGHSTPARMEDGALLAPEGAGIGAVPMLDVLGDPIAVCE